jgi:hypothetical protein
VGQPLLQDFPPASTLGKVVLHPHSLAGLFIYSSVRDCPSPTLPSSGHPTLFTMCLFVVVVYSVFFLFFPWVKVSLSRGLGWSGPELFVGVPCAA